jgi:Fe-S cluster assembly ATP-binding protein
MLAISNLNVEAAGKVILKDFNLQIASGELHLLLGPNGSGKTTLTKLVLGHSDIKAVKGTLEYNGKDLLKMKPEERALQGIFIAFQNPIEVPGVNFREYMRLAYNNLQSKEHKLPPFKFYELLKDKAKLLGIDEKLISRNLNEDLSGGEKKKMEILQMLILRPKLAILDETDSGLDIDSLKLVFKAICIYKKESGCAVILITHNLATLNYLEPDLVHVIIKGSIVATGGKEIIDLIREKGFKQWQKN